MNKFKGGITPLLLVLSLVGCESSSTAEKNHTFLFIQKSHSFYRSPFDIITTQNRSRKEK